MTSSLKIGTEIMESEVIIVGLGPVGAIAANLLGQYGVSTRVFEKSSEIYSAPRAIAIDSEALRVFGMLGMAEWIDEHIYKGGVEFRTEPPPRGNVLIDLSGLETRRRNGCQQLGTFHQPTVEKKLRDNLEKFPNVQVNLGHEVNDVQESDGKVYVTVRPVVSLSQQQYACKYLLACDGGRSFVRKRLGLKYAGFAIPEHWLVMDFDTYDKSIDARWPRTVFVGSPERTFLNARLPGGARRIEILLKEHEKALTVVREENTSRILAEIGLDVQRLSFERRMVYKFHARAVTEWCKGRIALLGDAAHCMPPTKGQGLCCGVEDAANICWKIAMLCRGSLGKKLGEDGTVLVDEIHVAVPGSAETLQNPAMEEVLKSYQVEREPWVMRQTQMIVSLRKFATSTSPFNVFLRNYCFWIFHLLAGHDFLQKEHFKGRPDLFSGIVHDVSPGSGRFFIQPTVTWRHPEEDTSGVLLDEVLGCIWCWMSFEMSPRDALSKEQYGYLDSIGCTFIRVFKKGTNRASFTSVPDEIAIVDETGSLRKWMERFAAHSVLLRPDRFVYGTANNSPCGEHAVDSLHRVLNGEKQLTIKRQPPFTLLPVRFFASVFVMAAMFLFMIYYLVFGF